MLFAALGVVYGDIGTSPLYAFREAVVAAILMVLGVVTATESWRLGARWTDDGPGAGYFPFYIALVMSLASAALSTSEA